MIKSTLDLSISQLINQVAHMANKGSGSFAEKLDY